MTVKEPLTTLRAGGGTGMAVRGGLLVAGRVLATLMVLLSSAWVCLALWYQLPGGTAERVGICVLWSGADLAVLVLVWRRGGARALLSYGVAFCGMLLWWGTILPSQDRPWADDVARQLGSTVEGSRVTLTNVRNFDWRSDSDYTQRWETRTYDLDGLRSADVAVSYWGNPAIAHTLVSFGFDDGRYLTFSIEIRKERDESFSSIGGFFKQFETTLVAADEHDILRVRTNVRGEDLYLYRLRLPQQDMRSLFLAYLGEADALARAPVFYNTLTANCTTIVYEMARRIEPGLPLDYRLLASGYLPAYLHDVGGLQPGQDLATLRAAGHVTPRAKAADAAPAAEFSRLIREGMAALP